MADKRAYIFPGQGAQFPGMGKDLYDSNPKARDLFEHANEVLGFRITDIMFNGTDEQLLDTSITQPATFLHSVITEMCSDIPEPDMVAGHSLGEFSALVACKAVDFDDALRLVSVRAQAMETCCKRIKGTMAAIIGLDSDSVEKACASVRSGIVVAANYNCEGQVVVSGEAAAVEEAVAHCKELGARRALPLAVAGAFHSPLMKPAGDVLKGAIMATKMRKPAFPIYQNYTSLAETDPERIRLNLYNQLFSSVMWTQTVKHMLEDGAASFTSIGPGTALVRLVKKTADAQGLTPVLESIQ